MVRNRIKSAHQDVRIKNDPKDDQPDRNADELPTATKLSNQISSAIRDGQSRSCFLVDVARDPGAQEFVSASQPVSKRTKHLQGDVRIRAHKGQKGIT